MISRSGLESPGNRSLRTQSIVFATWYHVNTSSLEGCATSCRCSTLHFPFFCIDQTSRQRTQHITPWIEVRRLYLMVRGLRHQRFVAMVSWRLQHLGIDNAYALRRLGLAQGWIASNKSSATRSHLHIASKPNRPSTSLTLFRLLVRNDSHSLVQPPHPLRPTVYKSLPATFNPPHHLT